MLTKAKIDQIRDLGSKRCRDVTGTYVVEGPKAILEFVESRFDSLAEVYAVRSWLEQNYNSLSSFHGPVVEISERELQRMSFLKNPNQVLAVFKKPARADPFVPKGSLILALDDIQDPGNMGTIIRCADWFGITDIVCSPACADAYNPKVVQATMGSLARIRIETEDLLDFVDKHENLPIYGADLSGRSVYDSPIITEGLLIIGNESKGISSPLLQRITNKLTIPRLGKAESLNAAVATGIILSHICRR